MQIVVTAFLDESQALVEESIRLVDLYQDKHPDFPQRLIGWLRRAEATLRQHRRSQLAPLSALRARALAAVAGVHEGADPAARRLQARKQTAGACALLLGQAQGLLHEAQAALEPKRDEAARLIQQMLQILLQGGVLQPLLAQASGPAERLTLVWQACQTRPEVANGARQILGLVAWADALRLIDETLDAWRL
ncbi:hypothetical protein [Malikia sp.]|uniref:hypothetical protein n=1 Tax=Malikia sp. TaxID=2070706 RepID=UPI0026379939|nr:hypothetical protein [Malikia sp.]MDD2729604.1 hypothetical protein [Malikia sp.]